MNYIMIFIIGVIVGIILMAIAVASDERWGYRDNTKTEEQEILDQLRAAEFGIIRVSKDDNYDIVKVSDDLFYIKRRNK